MENNIPLLNMPYSVIKGITVAQNAYSDLCLRGTSDIDILVGRKDISNIKSILNKNGFVKGYIDDGGNLVTYKRNQEVFFMAETHQTPTFIKPTRSKMFPYVCIDINFSKIWGESSLKIKSEDILKKTVEMSYAGTSFRGLPLEISLVQLCLHNYKENNSIFLLSKGNGINLRRFYDIYSLFLSSNFNQEIFSNSVEYLGVEKYVLS